MAELERAAEERDPEVLRLVPLDAGDLDVERDAAPCDRLPPNEGRGLDGERAEGEALRERPVDIAPPRDPDGLYPPPELRPLLGVRVCGDVRLVDGTAVERLGEAAPGE